MAANTQGFRLYQRGEHKAALERFKQAVLEDETCALGHYNLAATVARLDAEDHCELLSNEIDSASSSAPGEAGELPLLRLRRVSEPDVTPSR